MWGIYLCKIFLIYNSKVTKIKWENNAPGQSCLLITIFRYLLFSWSSYCTKSELVRGRFVVLLMNKHFSSTLDKYTGSRGTQMCNLTVANQRRCFPPLRIFRLHLLWCDYVSILILKIRILNTWLLIQTVFCSDVIVYLFFGQSHWVWGSVSILHADIINHLP